MVNDGPNFAAILDHFARIRNDLVSTAMRLVLIKENSSDHGTMACEVSG
jgi:hypothetical protein